MTVDKNKSTWRDRADSCDSGLEPSGAVDDMRPPLVFKKRKSSVMNGDIDHEIINGVDDHDDGV